MTSRKDKKNTSADLGANTGVNTETTGIRAAIAGLEPVPASKAKRRTKAKLEAELGTQVNPPAAKHAPSANPPTGIAIDVSTDASTDARIPMLTDIASKPVARKPRRKKTSPHLPAQTLVPAPEQGQEPAATGTNEADVLASMEAMTADARLVADAEGFRPISAQEPKKKRTWRWALWSVFSLLLLGAILGAGFYYEVISSYAQSRWFVNYVDGLRYHLDSGESTRIHFPSEGPFDTRMGYVGLPAFIERLHSQGMTVEQQARWSEAMLAHSERGYFVPYPEKTQTGLVVSDWRGDRLYNFSYPQWSYENFSVLPPLMVQTLLFIENRALLQNEFPWRNPAVDWPRFSKAVLFKLGEKLHINTPSMGASTLATQIEKYRHSPDGITSSNQEKLEQMFSASTRVYQSGRDTFAARQQLVLDYLNTVPLSAAPGYGEVNGIADGLRVWFAADIETVNAALNDASTEPAAVRARGLALKRVLALMIAHRRPSYYLAAGQKELSALTDSYLRILTNAAVITPALRDAALDQALQFRDYKQAPVAIAVDSNKGDSVVRNRLGTMLGVSLYDLDRLDLTAVTTLSGQLQDQISAHLASLSEAKTAEKFGLIGENLLTPEQTPALRFSFILTESTDYGNRVRVQTDNTGQPLDINEGSKLELGSTAKLRVLTTYLEIIAELHDRYSGMELEALLQTRTEVSDIFSSWVLDQFIATAQTGTPESVAAENGAAVKNAAASEIGVAELLQLALDRTYSANPNELFYTGGGLLSFRNFKPEDSGRTVSLREATQESINLPYVRLLRDIVHYTIAQKWQNRKQLLANDDDPRRREVLAQFIDQESAVFLSRFWSKYQRLNSRERLDALLGGIRATPVRLASIHRYLLPEAEQKDFAQFMRDHLPGVTLSKAELTRLYQRYGRDAFSLEDQAYLARVHPLELWLLRYRQDNESASLKQAQADSADIRQQVYGWLLRSKSKDARDDRIQIALEVEAFSDIHQRWKKLRYPFDHMVPSLASALGSSGDRPAALAELMGIIVNGGKYAPAVRIEKLHFAAGTPYETSLIQPPKAFRQVMDPAVATALRGILASVVEHGTGRRMQQTFFNADGSVTITGGKTGTGDNRLVTVSATGERIKSRALNRTATFVFYLGAHHFGVLTAFVDGSKAGGFKFTSALPVQVLKGMVPLLQKHLLDADERQKLRTIVNDELETSEVMEPVPESVPESVTEPVTPNEIAPAATTNESEAADADSSEQVE